VRLSPVTLRCSCLDRYDLVGPVVRKHANAELVWVQEEPKNMGAWAYVKPRFDTTLREEGVVKSIRYVGRPPSSSPATGGYKQHFKEQKDLVSEALS
jgi:2-oxoglutarate dehydrogenase E1 component